MYIHLPAYNYSVSKCTVLTLSYTHTHTHTVVMPSPLAVSCSRLYVCILCCCFFIRKSAVMLSAGTVQRGLVENVSGEGTSVTEVVLYLCSGNSLQICINFVCQFCVHQQSLNWHVWYSVSKEYLLTSCQVVSM